MSYQLRIKKCTAAFSDNPYAIYKPHYFQFSCLLSRSAGCPLLVPLNTIPAQGDLKTIDLYCFSVSETNN